MNSQSGKGHVRELGKQRPPFLYSMALVLAVVASGCASMRSADDGRMLASADSVDAKTLAKSQAALALNKAQAAEQQEKTDEAIRYYEQARMFEPGLVQLNRRLAVLYDRRGDDARAHAAYEQALRLQPHDADLLNDFGVFHLHRENWPAAETWFRRTLTVDATHRRATTNLAMTLAMQNRLKESYDAFAHVVGPAAAYSNLGVLLTRQGRIEEAREHFRRALAIDSTVHPAGQFLSQLDRAPVTPAPPASGGPITPASYQF